MQGAGWFLITHRRHSVSSSPGIRLRLDVTGPDAPDVEIR